MPFAPMLSSLWKFSQNFLTWPSLLLLSHRSLFASLIWLLFHTILVGNSLKQYPKSWLKTGSGLGKTISTSKFDFVTHLYLIFHSKVRFNNYISLVIDQKIVTIFSITIPPYTTINIFWSYAKYQLIFGNVARWQGKWNKNPLLSMLAQDKYFRHLLLSNSFQWTCIDRSQYAKHSSIILANAGDPWVGKIPWRRAWQPTLVFLPGESHGQRSLVSYSPWGCTESDMTEATQYVHTCIFFPSSLYHATSNWVGGGI